MLTKRRNNGGEDDDNNDNNDHGYCNSTSKSTTNIGKLITPTAEATTTSAMTKLHKGNMM